MKNAISILICILTLDLFGQTQQEIEIKSDISEVTVYLNGAQITRAKTVDIPAGRSTLKFIGLSPYIDSKSISINAEGDFKVLSVNLQQNYLTENTKSKEIEELEKKRLEIESKIKTEKAYMEVLAEELNFLRVNSNIGGANTGTSLTSLKEANTYFNEKITSIKLKQIDREETIDKLADDLEKIQSQLASISNKKVLPTGEIIVSIESKSASKAAFIVKYVVANAGWTPSYDIKVENIELPTELTYKANVHQFTNEDWKNIKLKLSSSDPNTSNSYRELQTYFLNYNTVPPSYKNIVGQVTGRIYDNSTREPLPGATVMIKGTSIGTVADANGSYSLTIPPNGGTLVINFIGYNRMESPITSQQMDFSLEQNFVALEEVVVMGYGTQKKSLTGSVSSVNSSKIRTPEPAQKSSTNIEAEQVTNQTSVEFDIKTPYTIPSDGKNLTIDIENYSLPANYQYFCSPKIDKNAYLIAQIADWEKYNLLEGEANVFFEDTYTGKTLLDVRYMSDTLTISLGQDKGVSIQREIQKQFTTKQFLGSKKEETKSWLISIKNNKQQDIKISLTDQIPVATIEEIEVSPVDISNGKLDTESGLLKWEFQLKPAEKKELNLKYSVSYPKFRTLLIE